MLSLRERASRLTATASSVRTTPIQRRSIHAELPSVLGGSASFRDGFEEGHPPIPAEATRLFNQAIRIVKDLGSPPSSGWSTTSVQGVPTAAGGNDNPWNGQNCAAHIRAGLQPSGVVTAHTFLGQSCLSLIADLHNFLHSTLSGKTVAPEAYSLSGLSWHVIDSSAKMQPWHVLDSAVALLFHLSPDADTAWSHVAEALSLPLESAKVRLHSHHHSLVAGLLPAN